jgi:hypothetical protein
VANITPRPLYPPGKNPVSLIEYETGWVPGPAWKFWKREESLVPLLGIEQGFEM